MGDDVKPLTGKYFSLDLKGGESDLKFTSCTLPSGTLTPHKVPFVNGQAKSETASLPVDITWEEVTIVRALDDKSTFYTWFKQGIPDDGGGTGAMEKKEITLTLHDSDGGDKKKWILQGAYPSSHKPGGTLNAGSSEIVVESITIHFDHCKVE